MSTPTPESTPPPEPFLIEPATPDPAATGSEALDTSRILRETSAIPRPGPDDAVVAPPMAEPEGTTDNPPARTNVLAVVALVLGLTLSPFAALFGYIAVGQIRRAGQRGEGFAWTAVALGWLWIVLYTVIGVVFGTLWREIL